MSIHTTNKSSLIFQARIRRNYLRSGFVIDVMACLPYDALNMFDDVFDEPVPGMTTDAT